MLKLCWNYAETVLKLCSNYSKTAQKKLLDSCGKIKRNSNQYLRNKAFQQQDGSETAPKPHRNRTKAALKQWTQLSGRLSHQRTNKSNFQALIGVKTNETR